MTAPARLCLDDLEGAANVMLNSVAQGGVRTRNSRFIAMAEDGAEEVRAAIEAALSGGTLSMEALSDCAYRPIAGTDPVQYRTDFVDVADRLIRPLIDRHSVQDSAVIGCCLIDMNGFLPTHVSARSQPQRPNDRRWNMEHARNRQIFMGCRHRILAERDGEGSEPSASASSMVAISKVAEDTPEMGTEVTAVGSRSRSAGAEQVSFDDDIGDRMAERW
ncbi:MAG: hypothetical protein U5M50_05910 [Sphingobium sp.]|nr:hypothetical protein [Sphingobium sp.]